MPFARVPRPHSVLSPERGVALFSLGDDITCPMGNAPGWGGGPRKSLSSGRAGVLGKGQGGTLPGGSASSSWALPLPPLERHLERGISATAFPGGMGVLESRAPGRGFQAGELSPELAGWAAVAQRSLQEVGCVQAAGLTFNKETPATENAVLGGWERSQEEAERVPVLTAPQGAPRVTARPHAPL